MTQSLETIVLSTVFPVSSVVNKFIYDGGTTESSSH
jgi:hypothetical protein